MKKIIFVAILLLICISVFAQKQVSYASKIFAAEGCEVTYTVRVHEGSKYITTAVKSDRLVFDDSPVLMLKTFNGDVIKF